MVELFTVFYPINDKARAVYDGLIKDHRCLFVNSGSLRGSSDQWTREHVLLEQDYEDNIACRNANFNELTAWWAAKNFFFKDVGPEEWVQCSHYRKRLDLAAASMSDDVDIYVARPYPMVFYMNGLPDQFNVESGFKLCHPAAGWDVMESVVKELSPDEAGAFDVWKSFLQMPAPVNVYAMRKKLLDEYWDWLFPRIFEIDRHLPKESDEYKTAYQQRWGGFIAERLFSFWVFMKERMFFKINCVQTTVREDFKPFSDKQERNMSLDEKSKYFS